MKTSHLLLIASLVAAPAFADTHIGIGISFGAPAPVIVHRAPPVRRVEVRTVAPGPGYVWVAGHYTRAGNRWIWMSGMWVVPPRPDAYWVDAAWNPGSHQWIEAHWEVASPAAVVVAPPPPPATVVVPATPAPTEIVVQEAPPPVYQDEIIERPGPGYVWIGGYWGWEHGRREWVRGHWELPPRGHRTWVEPRWEHRERGYVFIRGYWR